MNTLGEITTALTHADLSDFLRDVEVTEYTGAHADLLRELFPQPVPAMRGLELVPLDC